MSEIEYIPNVTYQHFSKTKEKFERLKMPELKGKRFLDLGCNLGFYCRHAKDSGAARVLGIDNSSKVIKVTRENHPDIEFRDTGWDRFPEGPFDVIIWLSAIHYAKDPLLTTENIWRNLSYGGLLILECGVLGMNSSQMASNFRAPVWREVGDKSHHLTKNFLYDRLLKDFDVNYIGPSVHQDGDPADRHVFHAYKPQPQVIMHKDSIQNIGYLWSEVRPDRASKIDLVEFVEACMISLVSIAPEHKSNIFFKHIESNSTPAENLAKIYADEKAFFLFVRDALDTLEPSCQRIMAYSIPEGRPSEIFREACLNRKYYVSEMK